MIPLRDDIPSRTRPWVNNVVIALCGLAFLAQETSSDHSEGIVAKFAMAPLRLSDPNAVPVINEQHAVRTSNGVVVFTTIVVPAPIFFGFWFLLQLYSGVGSLVGEPAAGAAWWAHAGGFVAGVVAAFAVSRLPIGSPPVTERRF